MAERNDNDYGYDSEESECFQCDGCRRPQHILVPSGKCENGHILCYACHEDSRGEKREKWSIIENEGLKIILPEDQCMGCQWEKDERIRIEKLEQKRKEIVELKQALMELTNNSPKLARLIELLEEKEPFIGNRK